VSSRLAFAGSKRKARRIAAEEREVARLKADLQSVAELSEYVRDDAHLEQILTDVFDVDQRDAVRKLIEPFLRYRITRVESEPPPC
jgi:class 3 adenylate cyclase